MSEINLSDGTSSKAVLAALRALQDKIRRLESEKSHAMDEASKLRRQIRSFESVTESRREQDMHAAKKSIQEAELIHQQLNFEKKDLEKRISSLEESNRRGKQNIDELLQKIKKVELDRSSLENRVVELDHLHQRTSSELQVLQKHEKGSPSFLRLISPLI